MMLRSQLRQAPRCTSLAAQSVRYKSYVPKPEDIKNISKLDPLTPRDIAQQSTIRINLPQNPAPVKPKQKRPMLSDSKFEKEGYQMSGFMKTVGELAIAGLRLDMDRIRAGPIAASVYYAECKKQGLQFEDEELSNSARFFYEDLKLPRTFSQWFQITALHTWMLSVRMRAMPFKYGRNYQQKLIDRFFRDMELRLHDEMNVNSSRISDTYLKDYNSQLRGLVCSYDEGFATDDATLATAIWRNLFNARSNMDFAHLEAAVKYVREQLYILSKMSDRDFAFGKFQFVAPDELVVRFTKEQEAEMLARAKAEYEPEGKKLLPSQRSKLAYDN